MSAWSEEHGYRELARIEMPELLAMVRERLAAAGVEEGGRVFMIHDPTDSAVLFCVTSFEDAEPSPAA